MGKPTTNDTGRSIDRVIALNTVIRCCRYNLVSRVDALWNAETRFILIIVFIFAMWTTTATKATY